MAIARRSPVAPGALVAEKYLVEEVLGAGAMGIVVAATHIDLGQRVAIKFLTSNTPGHGERFLREARATVRLRSEHAARVYDVGTLPDGTPFMVLELLEGHNLAQVIRDEAPLPVAQAADFVIQTCEAVAEAHALGIVHRDIKPQNLFLTRGVAGEGVVKVLDFGIAKSLEVEGANALTQTSSLMGSPIYMSPEMMRSAKNVLPQNDIWALGVVLQELLTRRLPFDGDAFPELCLKVVHDAPRSPLDDRADLPAGIVAIIGRCLAKNPAERFATAADLATALEAFAPPASRFVAERARHLSAHAGSRGMFGTNPTLPSLPSGSTAPRSVTELGPVSVRFPTSGPLPQLGGQTTGLVATANPQVLDTSPPRSALPIGGSGPWILGSVAVICLTVVVGGVFVLSRDGRTAANVPPYPPIPTQSAPPNLPLGAAPPSSSADATSPRAAPVLPTPPPSASAGPPRAGPGAIKPARSAAPRTVVIPATGDEIPSLR